MLSQLHPVSPPPDPVAQMAKVVGLKNAMIQGKDLEAQIAERQANAQKEMLANQKQQRLSQLLSNATVDPQSGLPDMGSPAMQQVMREFPDVHAALSEHYAKVAGDRISAKKTQSEIDHPKIDEFSPEGIAAKIAIAQGTPRNIDPLSPAGIAAKWQEPRNIDPLSPEGLTAKAKEDALKPKPLDIQELDQFNNSPGLVKQFGAGPLGLSAKKQADQLKLHTSEATQTAAAQQALQQGAVKNVAPHLITPATEAYAKDSKAYVDAAQAADDMKTFVNDAKTGNKVAYSFIPAEGALYLTTSRGVKRINLNEMNAYGGGGSAWDRVVAFIGKQASGASIPADILADMDAVNKGVGTNAKTAYQRKVAVTNQAFGSTFQPMEFGGESAAPSGNPFR